MHGSPLVSRSRLLAVCVAGAALVSACGATADELDDTTIEGSSLTDVEHIDDDLIAQRDPDVPDLPFDDNPDPNQCGIPVQWGPSGQAWLSGVWEGELIQPEVLLYDSHQRRSITARAAHGTEVQVVLFQENPVLDYYLVDLGAGEEGWIPAPFLSFDPVV